MEPATDESVSKAPKRKEYAKEDEEEAEEDHLAPSYVWFHQPRIDYYTDAR